MNAKELIKLCKNKTVWIQTHNYPDPDAIACAYALQELLANFKIEAMMCYDGEIDKLSSSKMMLLLNTDMASSYSVSEQMKEEDMIILVDCQKNGGNTTDFLGDEQAVIDHHPTFVEVDYLYKDIRITGACSSLIAQYFKELGVTPSSKAATALVYGIKMDTLQFSRGVTKFDIDMFSYLFDFMDQKLLTDLETNNLELFDLQAYGSAIENVKTYGKVAFSFIDFECPDALVAILSDFLLSLIEVEVVILYAQRKGGYKFSYRSEREDVNAGELANDTLKQWGNGGGHAQMAGGFVKEENLNNGEMNLYDFIQKHFMKIINKKYPQVI